MGGGHFLAHAVYMAFQIREAISRSEGLGWFAPALQWLLD